MYNFAIYDHAFPYFTKSNIIKIQFHPGLYYFDLFFQDIIRTGKDLHDLGNSVADLYNIFTDIADHYVAYRTHSATTE